MEGTAWTDGRLGDLAKRVDAGFDRVDADIRELRLEMRGGFGETHRQLSEAHHRIDALGSELRAELDSLRMTILRVGGGVMIGLIGVIAAVLARGV
jgi:hypothetical protein